MGCFKPSLFGAKRRRPRPFPMRFLVTIKPVLPATGVFTKIDVIHRYLSDSDSGRPESVVIPIADSHRRVSPHSERKLNMKHTTRLLIAAVAMCMVSCVPATAQHEFTYNGDTGPGYWSDLENCYWLVLHIASRAPVPINIDDAVPDLRTGRQNLNLDRCLLCT